MKWSEIHCPERSDYYGPYDENEKIVRGWFLYSIGIDLENIPDDLFESCEFLDATQISLSKPYEAKVHIREIVGTTHDLYGGKTWVDAFIHEHKIASHLSAGRVTKGKYFRMLKRPIEEQNSHIKLIKKKNGDYYIHGSGNHRITFYKLMYLSELANENIQTNKYWLFAEIFDEV